MAQSLSVGDVAVRDAAAASSLGGQERSGDPTDYAFDVLSVASHPLDGGASDFIAYEKVRFHSSGGANNIVELYHRDAVTAPWKAAYRAYFADNIELPDLRLDHNGSGHLLTAGERAQQNAQPEDLAAKYAEAVAVGASPAQTATFAPGQFTIGEVTDARGFVSTVADHGNATRQWLARPGGVAVELTSGVLAFANVQRMQAEHEYTGGSLRYFVVQDAMRIEFGGLLAPGHYASVTSVSSAMISVVVVPGIGPDVVGRDSQITSIEGQLSSL